MADALARGAVLAVVALSWVVVQVRMVGLRSLSKMTSFDFVMTIALGSLVAGAAQAANWSQFVQPLAAMTGLFFAQWLAARLRKLSDVFEEVIQNRPMLLMRDGKIDHQALKHTRVAESDLLAKLRHANVLNLKDVRAVVLETTGDVSVLQGEGLDEIILKGVNCKSE
ncbi:MAG: YetF domain-containing protein [Sphingomonadaceae bacterium]